MTCTSPLLVVPRTWSYATPIRLLRLCLSRLLCRHSHRPRYRHRLTPRLSLTDKLGFRSKLKSTTHKLQPSPVDGIPVGAAMIGVLMIDLVIFCCVRARKQKRTASASSPPTYIPPSMQQHPQPSPPPKSFGAYQSVPQQEQQRTQLPWSPRTSPVIFPSASFSRLAPVN